MNFKCLLVLFALVAVSSCAFYRDSSEEEKEAEYACNRLCPNDDAVRGCCQEHGFSTGYCKGYGGYRRADCEGRRGFFRRITGV